MTNQIRCSLSYFGYSVEFATVAATIAERRAEANRLIIAKYGETPALSYVQPRLPFPDFVPVQTWGPIGNEGEQGYA
jgi:hypothetical protein